MKPIKIKRKLSKNPLTQPLLWAAIAFTPAAVYAECTQDSDCAEGEICESAPISVGDCFFDEEGVETCTGEEEVEAVGYCTEAPIDCVQDSDCPSHLRCANSQRPGSSGGSGSSMSSQGSSGDPSPSPNPDEAEPESDEAEDPDADQLVAPEEEESMMCVYISTQCETDSDCSADFHCETHSYAVDCAVPVICEQSEEEGEDNALDENCYPAETDVDCGEEEVTEGFCEPNEIECDSDDACPTDWRCQEIIHDACGDLTITTNSDGEPERDEGEPEADESEPEVDEVAPREPEDCAETARSMCVPVGVDYGSHYVGEHRDSMPGSDPETDPLDNQDDDGGNGSDGGDGNDGNDGDDDDNPPIGVSDNNDVEESSCSANSRGASPWTLFGLLALLGLRRRAVALD
jgi:hypothetical protein